MTAVLHALLFLLKWIGILLLVLLGLLLLIVLLVLLAPVRYRGRLDKKEAPEEIFRADGLVSWLNPLLRVRVHFAEKKLHYTVRIFGICLLNSDKPKKEKPVKEKKKNKKSKKEKKRKEKPGKENGGAAPTEQVVGDGDGTVETVTQNLPEAIDTSDTVGDEMYSESVETAEQGTGDTAENADEVQGKKKVSLLTRIKQIIEKIKAIPEKIKQKVTYIVETIKLLWHKKEKVVIFLQDELHKTAIGKAWDTIKQILRHILPGKIKGQVEFGTGDPASTGKALGVLGMLYAWYGKGVTIVPDFYEKRVVAELEFKGRIRFGTLLIKGLRLIRDKHVKRLVKNFKKLLNVLKQKAE